MDCLMGVESHLRQLPQCSLAIWHFQKQAEIGSQDLNFMLFCPNPSKQNLAKGVYRALGSISQLMEVIEPPSRLPLYCSMLVTYKLDLISGLLLEQIESPSPFG
jgi:hypothetical protein